MHMTRFSIPVQQWNINSLCSERCDAEMDMEGSLKSVMYMSSLHYPSMHCNSVAIGALIILILDSP